MNSSVIFMQRALDLALLGQGRVSPNPMVGCVIVHDGKVIGEGWHDQYGGPHAEVNAIATVENKTLLSESTCYVSLEPCSHFGKTPPCADLLIHHRIPRIIIANQDPNPLVAGKGITKLRETGAVVEVGLLEREGLELNKRFFTFIQKQRPYVILKWAQTCDNFIARADFDSKWISNQYSRQLVHRWRAEEDAVLIGKNTAKFDNPKLSVRDWSGRNPVRVVLDHNGALDKSLAIFDGSQQTICYTTAAVESLPGAEIVQLKEDRIIADLLADLYTKKIASLIVEGGAATLQEFIDANLWDEARIFTAPVAFEKGINAPVITGNLIEQHHVFNDILSIYKNPQTSL